MPTTRSQTRAALTAAAAAALATRVFAIPELLETILLSTGFFELRNCRRVNSTFMATIEGSGKLRRKYRVERVEEREKAMERERKALRGVRAFPKNRGAMWRGRRRIMREAGL